MHMSVCIQTIQNQNQIQQYAPNHTFHEIQRKEVKVKYPVKSNDC